jgi:hypothetical protein
MLVDSPEATFCQQPRLNAFTREIIGRLADLFFLLPTNSQNLPICLLSIDSCLDVPLI